MERGIFLCPNGRREDNEMDKVKGKYFYSGATKHFNEKGQLHRTDGPAVDCPEGLSQWYIDGVFVIDPGAHLLRIPRNDDEKLDLIGVFGFIENKDGSLLYIKEWLRRDKKFYDRYRLLIEG